MNFTLIHKTTTTTIKLEYRIRNLEYLKYCEIKI